MSEEAAGPLAGVKVVAIEQSVAGPLCSRILADMGAEVVKVEAPRGDFARQWDHHVAGEASHFVWLSRRKRSIALDLKDPAERGVLDDLLAAADVLVYNLSAGAAARLELTVSRLEAQFPRLVACQITGYGTRGRLKDRKAYDMLLQAESGLIELTGDPASPARIGVSVSDIGTGLYASSLILAALYERERTGRGRAFDLTMFEAMNEFAGPNLTAYAGSGVAYPRIRGRHHNIVPYGLFECRDGSIALAIEHDEEWRIFCSQVLVRPDLDTDRFATNPRRVELRAELEPIVEAILRARSKQHWLERLEAASLAYGSLNGIEEVWNHPVARDLGLHRSVRLPSGTVVEVPTSPAERVFGRVGGVPAVPGLNQHGEEIRRGRRRPT